MNLYLFVFTGKETEGSALVITGLESIARATVRGHLYEYAVDSKWTDEERNRAMDSLQLSGEPEELRNARIIAFDGGYL